MQEVLVDDTAAEPRPEPVGFALRAGARILDGVYFQIAAAATGIMLGLVAGVLDLAFKTGYVEGMQAAGTGGIHKIAIGILAMLSYEAICEGIHGSTVGKRVLGITVLRDDHSPCRFRSAVVRSLAFLVDGLFFGAVAYASMRSSNTQQRFGDRWAGTVVVRRASVPESSRREGGRFLAAVLAGTAALMGLVALRVLL